MRHVPWQLKETWWAWVSLFTASGWMTCLSIVGIGFCFLESLKKANVQPNAFPLTWYKCKTEPNRTANRKITNSQKPKPNRTEPTQPWHVPFVASSFVSFASTFGTPSQFSQSCPLGMSTTAWRPRRHKTPMCSTRTTTFFKCDLNLLPSEQTGYLTNHPLNCHPLPKYQATAKRLSKTPMSKKFAKHL